MRHHPAPPSHAHTRTDSLYYVQIVELTEKITAYEEDVQELIAASSKQPAVGNRANDDDEHAAHAGEGDEAGIESSDESEDENEDQFIELEEDLANVIADVHDLGEQKGREGGSGELSPEADGCSFMQGISRT